MQKLRFVGFGLVAWSIFAVGAVRAADITMVANGTNTVGFSYAACWSDNKAPSSANDYWVFDYIYYSKDGTATGQTFAGRTLNIGAPSTSAWGFKSGKLYSRTVINALTVPNLVWWNGNILPYYGNSPHIFKGTWTVRQADAQAVHNYGVNATSYNMTNMVTHVSADDDANAANAVISITQGVASSPGNLASMETGKQATYHFRGDNSGYKGKFDVTRAYQPFVIWNGTVIGDPNTPKADAIRLASNACFAMGANFEQNTSRGIEIYGTSAYFMTWDFFAKDYTVRYPICGTGGLVKHGPGRVRLDGAYTAGAITVSQGRLILCEHATFPANHPVTVKAGATLGVSAAKPALDITCEPGAEVYYNVPYDAATGVTQPIDLTDGGVVTSSPVKIGLSAPLAIPLNATNRLVMAYLPDGMSASDFTDVTDTDEEGFPASWLEVGTESGRRCLYRVARPMVVTVHNFDVSIEGNNAILGKAEWWSDGKLAHAGADYRILHSLNNIGNWPFPGESLTIGTTAGNVSPTINVRNEICRLDAKIWPKVTLTQLYSIRQHVVTGEVFVAGAFDSSAKVSMTAKYDAINLTDHKTVQSVSWKMNLHGEGPVAFTAGATNGINGVQGDNTDYFGRFFFSGYSNATMPAREDTGMQMRVWDAKNFGGALESFCYNALTINNNTRIIPQADIVLNTENRGFYVDTNGGFEVPAGRTFTLLSPLRIKGLLFKHGEGTLALGGAVSFGADGTSAGTGSDNQLLVRAGAIKPLADAAVRGFAANFADGTRILLSPSATLTDGLTGSVVIPDSGRVAVALDISEPGFVRKSYRLPNCTLAASAADLTEQLVPGRTRGYLTTIVKEPVDGDRVRYSAQFDPSGLAITVR